MSIRNVLTGLWVVCWSPIFTSAFSFFYRDLLARGAWRSVLLKEAAPRSGARVLLVCISESSISADLLAKFPGCSLSTLDPLDRALEATEGVERLSFEQGRIGCDGASFDKVICCMALHPLASSGKLALLKEMRRVLRFRGDFYLADFDKALSSAKRETMALIGTYRLYGSDSAVAHTDGILNAQIELAGFSHVKRIYNELDVTGRVSIFWARR